MRLENLRSIPKKKLDSLGGGGDILQKRISPVDFRKIKLLQQFNAAIIDFVSVWKGGIESEKTQLKVKDTWI